MQKIRHYFEGNEFCRLSLWDGNEQVPVSCFNTLFDLILIDFKLLNSDKQNSRKLLGQSDDVVCVIDSGDKDQIPEQNESKLNFFFIDEEWNKQQMLVRFDDLLHLRMNYLFAKLNDFVARLTKKRVSIQEFEKYINDFLTILPFASNCTVLWQHEADLDWVIRDETLNRDVVLKDFFISQLDIIELVVYNKTSLLERVEIADLDYIAKLPENLVLAPVKVATGNAIICFWGYKLNVEIAPINILSIRFLTQFLSVIIEHQILISKENVLQEKFNQVEKIKAAFLNNISHEIRTPLNCILGLSELICDSEISLEEKIEFFNQLKTSSKKLLGVFDDLIDLSRIEAGELQVELHKINLSQKLKSFHKENLNVYSNPDVEFVYEVGNQPDVNISVETHLFQRLLEIIIENAYKFTEKGSIRFGYHLFGDRVNIYIKDTGVGIEKELLPRLFQRFWQGDESLSRLKGGNGLGLYIAKKIIELMNGTIAIKSEIGVGTEIILNFPIIMSKTKDFPDWSDKKILIAEDNEANFVFLETVLKRTGINIIWATDGLEAIRIFEENPDLDLVLMDVYMPEMNGTEATKILREKTDIPIVAQTAYSVTDDDMKLEAYGFSHVIFKPIRPKGLLELIEEIFNEIS
ncbi:MAG: response regulator [Bacteroidales bacterium]|nr:response regulator [Bacteroidales bacterium]